LTEYVLLLAKICPLTRKPLSCAGNEIRGFRSNNYENKNLLKCDIVRSGRHISSILWADSRVVLLLATWQSSASFSINSSVFWGFRQRRVVKHGRFGSTNLSHLRGSCPRRHLTHEDGKDRLSRNVRA
jgi:hypothetical protein